MSADPLPDIPPTRLALLVAAVEEEIAQAEGWLAHVSWRKREGSVAMQIAAEERHLARLRLLLEELRA